MRCVVVNFLNFCLQVIEVGKRRANDMKDFIAKMVVAISKNPEVHDAEDERAGLNGRKMSYFDIDSKLQMS